MSDKIPADPGLPDGPGEENARDLPEELTGKIYVSGKIPVQRPEEPVWDDAVEEPTRPVSEADGAVEEPTRPISEFDRRTMALLGGSAWEKGAAAPAEDGQTPAEQADLVPEEGEEPASPSEPEEDAEEKRDYMPIRFRRDGRLGCLGGLMYATFVICLSIVLACAAWMAASDVLALNKDPVAAEVTLPDSLFSEKTVEVTNDDGSTTAKTVQSADMDAVARLLKDYGLINYKWLFKLYSSLSHADQKIDPGTYELSTSYDYRALVKKMQVGSDSQVQTKVTFPEGFTMQQIFERLEENGVCSREDLYAAAADTDFSYAFLENVGTGDASRLEGFLFPDTYFFYQGMQASSALNKFLSNFHYKITAEMWQKTYDQGMTFKQIVTIASIIEKEAANDEERALISSVIHNRLTQGMPLQMDSTVLYGNGDPTAEKATESMIANTDNLYNTYVYQGLPPGPICNPGMPSIQAALNPADTQYLYFTLNEETGAHEFFIFLNEFQDFVATQSYGQAG